MDVMTGRIIERLVIALSGSLCMYLGYRLFKINTERQGKLEIERKDKVKVSLSDVAPGIWFAAFGSAILVVALVNGKAHESAEEHSNSEVPATAMRDSANATTSPNITTKYADKNYRYVPPSNDVTIAAGRKRHQRWHRHLSRRSAQMELLVSKSTNPSVEQPKRKELRAWQLTYPAHVVLNPNRDTNLTSPKQSITRSVRHDAVYDTIWPETMRFHDSLRKVRRLMLSDSTGLKK